MKDRQRDGERKRERERMREREGEIKPEMSERGEKELICRNKFFC